MYHCIISLFHFLALVSVFNLFDFNLLDVVALIDVIALFGVVALIDFAQEIE